MAGTGIPRIRMAFEGRISPILQFLFEGVFPRAWQTRLPLMLAIQKSLQSTGAYVLEDPPGLPGFRGASVGPLRPIATRHLNAPRGSQSQASRKCRQCAPGISAKNARKVGNVELHGTSA
jgi:hypothetical protein